MCPNQFRLRPEIPIAPLVFLIAAKLVAQYKLLMVLVLRVISLKLLR